MDVLFEDNHVLVVNKPAGMLTQPDDSGRPNLEDQAKAYLQRPYLHAVHRLDRPVSGLVLFAKTSKALSRLNASLREGKFKKIYHAKVDTLPKQEEGTLIHYLLRDDDGTRVVPPNTSGAKEARLHYRIIKERGIVEIELITGRHHQIRAQLSAIGCPIVGDKKYGSKSNSETIQLSHVLLSFPHPITQEIITIKSDTFS